jgi:hypothetical protein
MQNDLEIYGEKTREVVERITEPPDLVLPGSETVGSTCGGGRGKKSFGYMWVLAIPIVFFVLVALWWQSIQLVKLGKSAESFGELKQGLGLALGDIQKQGNLLSQHSEESTQFYQNLSALMDSLDQRLKMIQGLSTSAANRALPDSAKKSPGIVKEGKGETATEAGNH